jgi:hypothetical protein
MIFIKNIIDKFVVANSSGIFKSKEYFIDLQVKIKKNNY